MDYLRRTFEPGGDHPHRIVPMEGLRGFAVVLVFLVHYWALFAPWLGGTTASGAVAWHLRGIGHTGVDLFFVLSGFLIYGAVIRRPLSFGPFMARRYQRIYPVFLAVFTVYVALAFTVAPNEKIPKHPMDAALYLPANLLLLPGVFPIEPFVTVAWSLSYEILYYLLIPLIVGALGIRRWRPTTRIAFFALAAAVLLSACLAFELPYARMAMFFVGIVIYEAINHLRAWAKPSGVRDAFATAALGGAFVIVMLLPGERWRDVPQALALALGMGLFIAASFRSGGALGAVFSWTPLRWLGNMSYSFYLTHGLALQLCALVLTKLITPRPLPDVVYWGLLPVTLLAACVVAAVFFVMIERPFSLNPRSRIGAQKPLEIIMTGAPAEQARKFPKRAEVRRHRSRGRM